MFRQTRILCLLLAMLLITGCTVRGTGSPDARESALQTGEAAEEEPVTSASPAPELTDAPAEPEPTEQPTQAPTEAPATEQPSPSPAQAQPSAADLPWLALYEPVFENYRAVAGADPNSFDYSKDTYSVLTSYDLVEGQPVMYGYLLRDVDGNGVPELLVGNMAADDGGIVHAMFTLVDNEPTFVLYSWARNRYYLTDSGEVYNAGSSGAMDSEYYVCSLSGTILKPLYGCFTSDEGGYGGFYTVSGGDRYSGSAREVSQEEFSRTLETMEAAIEPLDGMTPIRMN